MLSRRRATRRPQLGDTRGTETGFRYIKQGIIHASVNSLPRDEAAYAVEVALERKPIDVPGWDPEKKVYDSIQDPRTPSIITRQNVDEVDADWDV